MVKVYILSNIIRYVYGSMTTYLIVNFIAKDNIIIKVIYYS